MEFHHTPIMLKECVEGLKIKENGIYFDGTLGGGGHSEEILKRLHGTGRLIATDLDNDALKFCENRFSNSYNNYTLLHENFKNFSVIADRENCNKVDGVLLDLGISSYQIDNRERGFSYLSQNELDMRMNSEQSLSAKQVVNEYSPERLREILWLYGEERFAAKIVSNIVKAREVKPIERTDELVEIIDKSIPKKFQTDGHPAKRTFQAIRIEVNGELEGLKETVTEMALRLNKGGRICIITFHSLEDRIVKHCFKELEQDCECDKRLPVCVCGKRKEIEIITKKPIIATEEETEGNPRARSAKLRIAERI